MVIECTVLYVGMSDLTFLVSVHFHQPRLHGLFQNFYACYLDIITTTVEMNSIILEYSIVMQDWNVMAYEKIFK